VSHVRVGALAVCASVMLCACGGGVSQARLSAEEQNLQRSIRGLEAMLASSSAAGGRLVPFDQILVVVRQRLIQGLLDSALPIDQIVAAKYRISVSSARVLLEDGFAGIELQGRASLLAQPDVAADLTVYGALDVVDLDAGSGSLRARVRIFAVEARRIEALGLPVPVEQLVEDLSNQQVENFAPLLSAIDIPVSVGEDITLPAMGPEGGVTIGEARIPLGAVVEDVKSFRHRLWISIKATRTGRVS
jgi:hypothetical protein